jgi:hypothetical protein
MHLEDARAVSRALLAASLGKLVLKEAQSNPPPLVVVNASTSIGAGKSTVLIYNPLGWTSLQGVKVLVPSDTVAVARIDVEDNILPCELVSSWDGSSWYA